MPIQQHDVPAAAKRWSSSRLSETQFALLLILPVIAVLAAVVAYPLGYSVWMSLQRIDLIFNTTESVGLENYRDALDAPEIRHAFRITIYYTILVTIFSVAASIGGALLLNEKFRGRPLLMTIVILPWAVSLYATSIVWRYLYSPEWGMFNAILLKLQIIDRPFNFLSERWAVPGVALAHAWQIAPLGIYFILATLQVIPDDLYKMAKVDRLGPLGRFRHVVFPYIKSPLLIVMVLITVEAARAFDTIFFLTNGGPGNVSTTLSWAIYLETFQKRQYGYGAAIGWILVIFTMIITTIYFLLLFYRRKHKASDDTDVPVMAEGGRGWSITLGVAGALAIALFVVVARRYPDMITTIAGFVAIIAVLAIVSTLLIRSGAATRKMLIYGAAAMLLVWTIVPIYWLLNMSLMHKTELLTLPTHLFPHDPTASNFLRIFGHDAIGPNGEELLGIGQAPALKRGLVNSTMAALAVTALTMLIALPVSYALGRLNFRGKMPLLFVILATRSYPPISIVIPFFYLYTRAGLQGTLKGLIIIYFTLTVPMIVWVLTSFFSSLPRTVEAAARVDGNTRFQAFLKVILPMSWPGIAVATAISFMVCWNEFAFAQFLTAGSRAQTFPPVLPSMFFQISMPTEMAAASIIGIIPPAVLAYLFQRRIRSLNLVDPL
ncbi:MAG: ABC transporter permease subunit [Thermomicrobiales bacterium]